MVSVFSSIVALPVFEPRSGQTRDYKLVFSASLRSTYSVIEKVQRLVGSESRKMCQPKDCCYSDLALYKIN